MWCMAFLIFFITTATIIGMNILSWYVQFAVLSFIYLAYFAMAHFLSEHPCRDMLKTELLIAIFIFGGLCAWGCGIVIGLDLFLSISLTDIACQYERHVKVVAIIITMLIGFIMGKTLIVDDDPKERI